EEDESILEVATDKVDTEVPSMHAGILEQILAKEGDVVEVGKPIAIIAVKENGESKGSSSTAEAEQTSLEEDTPTPVAAEAFDDHTSNSAKLDKPATGRFYSPLVLNIAKQEQIPMQELELIAGRGKDGRVTKKDILAYLENRGEAGQA